METALKYNYDVLPSAEPLANMSLNSSTATRDMVFPSLGKPDKWVHENIPAHMHHRLFPFAFVPPTSSQTKALDFSSCNSLMPNGSFLEPPASFPSLNGYADKMRFYKPNQDLANEGLFQINGMDSILPAVLPGGKKKKRRPRKGSSLSSTTNASTPSDMMTADFGILPLMSRDNVESKSKQPTAKKNKGKKKQNSKSITKSLTAPPNNSYNEETTTDPKHSSSNGFHNSGLDDGQDIKSDDAKINNGGADSKAPSKNSKPPVKRKAPKSIVRDSYKKKCRDRTKFGSQTPSIKAAEELMQKRLLFERKSPFPTNGLGFINSELLHPYNASELCKEYPPSNIDPSSQGMLWNPHCYNRLSANKRSELATTDQNCLILEPGEVKRQHPSILPVNGEARPSMMGREGTHSNDIVSMYYCKFYETINQLYADGTSTQNLDGCQSPNSANPSLPPFPPALHSEALNGCKTSTTTNVFGRSSHENLLYPPILNSSTKQNGSLTKAEKRKLSETQSAASSCKQRKKKKKLNSHVPNNKILSSSTHHSQEAAEDISSPMLLLRATLLAKKALSEDNSSKQIISAPMNGTAEVGDSSIPCTSGSSVLDLSSTADVTTPSSQTLPWNAKEPDTNKLDTKRTIASDGTSTLPSATNLSNDQLRTIEPSGDSDNGRPSQILSPDHTNFESLLLALKSSDEHPSLTKSELADNSLVNHSVHITPLLKSLQDIGGDDFENLPNDLLARVKFVKLLQSLASVQEAGAKEPSVLEGNSEETDCVLASSEAVEESKCYSLQSDFQKPILKVPSFESSASRVLSTNSSEPSAANPISIDLTKESSSESNHSEDAAKSGIDGPTVVKLNPEASATNTLAEQSLKCSSNSRSSSVCTEDLFIIDDADEFRQEFEELALTAEEQEQVEDVEWRHWMERLDGTGLEFLAKDDPPVVSTDIEEQDDIDLILMNVRETISEQKEKHRQELLIQFENASKLAADLRNANSKPVSPSTVQLESEIPEENNETGTRYEGVSSSEILQELCNQGFLLSDPGDESETVAQKENNEDDKEKVSGYHAKSPAGEDKDELIISTLGWAESDANRPLSSAHMLHWSYCRMTNHLLDPTRESFKCPLCNYKSPRKGHVERHILIHSGEKPYSCSECSYRSHTKDAMALHARVHTGHKKFVCCQCPYATNRKIYLERHIALHDTDKLSPCTKCNDKFPTKKQNRQATESALEAGASSQNVETDSEAEETSALLSDELENNNEYGDVEVKQECDSEEVTMCGCQILMSKSDRKKGRVYSEDRPYPCSLCSYRATKKSLLDKHSKVHTGERPFPCPLCKYKASRKAHLLRHMRTHQKELE